MQVLHLPHTYMTPLLFHRYGKLANANTSLLDAWKVAETNTTIRSDFEGQAAAFKWSQTKMEMTPFWAYWFARNVITDHWPQAEEFIKGDQDAWLDYTAYVQRCVELGLLNKSVEEDPDFHVDDFGVIKGWKEGRKPVKKETPKKPEEDFGEIADRIAEKVAVFKKNRKLRSLYLEDEDES